MQPWKLGVEYYEFASPNSTFQSPTLQFLEFSSQKGNMWAVRENIFKGQMHSLR